MKSKKTFLLRIRLFSLLTGLFLCYLPEGLQAQSIFDANFNDFNFLAANKIHKVGTNGTAVGNVTLYTNIITISGQQIDCIVRTISLAGGTFTLPGGAPGGTIPFDYSSATGTGMSANQDRFFSPTFNWTAAGSCKFRFEFILGGSYNNGTNTGTPVILKNVYVNSYDIDGNGSANSNQNNEFSAFNSVQYKTGAGSNLTATYNTSTGLTRFRSNSTTNTTAVIDDATRVKVFYTALSTLDIIVGADGGGTAYYFLDFGQGPAWTVTPPVNSSPVLDLNPSTTGLDNSALICNGLKNFTSGGTSISNSSNAIDELEILFPSSDIIDGNAEFLIPKTPASTTDSIRLVAPFTGSQSILLSGATYNITKSTGGGTDTMRVRPVSGTFTTAQAEVFLDSLRYINIKPLPTTGVRDFNLTIRESFFKSVAADFRADVNCSLLPVTWLSFSATWQKNNTVHLRWSTAQESNTVNYLVQHSTDGFTWNTIGSVTAAGNSVNTTDYTYTHLSPDPDKNYYRLVQKDINGNNNFSAIRMLSFPTNQAEIFIKNNPAKGTLQLQLTKPATIKLMNNNGQVMWIKKLNSGLQNIDVSSYPGGLYFLQSETTTLKVLIQ